MKYPVQVHGFAIYTILLTVRVLLLKAKLRHVENDPEGAADMFRCVVNAYSTD